MKKDGSQYYLGFTVVKFISSLPIGKFVFARAKTNSMYPTITLGQVIKITRVPYQTLKVGDIIAFVKFKHKNIFVHRISRIANHRGGLTIYTKGDNSDLEDPQVITQKEIIGKITPYTL
jgi:signal peptidase I